MGKRIMSEIKKKNQSIISIPIFSPKVHLLFNSRSIYMLFQTFRALLLKRKLSLDEIKQTIQHHR